MVQRALILCTGNSCRSQMAERLFPMISNGNWEAVSAGSNPSGYVHPKAIEVMQELGVDLSNGVSEHVDVYREQEFDLVVTVCDNAAESCPQFVGAKNRLHWPFDDPADASGSDAEVLNCFRAIRDQIAQRITQYLNSGD
ncbi:MAG: low molecular weight phosphatase family protein [Planctomycetaceae bacterium]|nr:low molecular weight phosphatase family protein [Planctomycetaceae bacterium]